MTAGGNATFEALPTTVFEVMSRLAAECNSINLGQGFPDDQLEGPAEMKDVVHRWVGGWRRHGGAGLYHWNCATVSKRDSQSGSAKGQGR